jgi:hypothetical protein
MILFKVTIARTSDPMSHYFVLRVFLVMEVDILTFIFGLCVRVHNRQFIVSTVSCYILMSVDKALGLCACGGHSSCH